MAGKSYLINQPNSISISAKGCRAKLRLHKLPNFGKNQEAKAKVQMIMKRIKKFPRI